MYREDVAAHGESSGISLQHSLSAFITKVYWWMAFALLVTGLCAFGVGTSKELARIFIGNQIIFFGLIIAEILLVIGIGSLINKISASTATALFIAYAAMNGLTLSVIFIAYKLGSIGSAFGITAGLFGIMALYGTFTKKDLTSIGNICFMALIGVILASVINIFIGSSLMGYIISWASVLVFTGLTAYDSQRIKAMYLDSDDSSETRQKIAVLGALSLYLDFINLFLAVLRIFGGKR